MSVIVDSTVWSLAFRRPPSKLSTAERAVVEGLTRVIRAKEVALLGLVRQEVLSGIHVATEYERLKMLLRAWDDERPLQSDHEEAARCYNQLRINGIAASPVDVLLCAVSIRIDSPIFTTDPDFTHYIRFIPIRLFDPFA